jgi:hypothetical protein
MSNTSKESATSAAMQDVVTTNLNRIENIIDYILKNPEATKLLDGATVALVAAQIDDDNDED